MQTATLKTFLAFGDPKQDAKRMVKELEKSIPSREIG